MDKVLKRILGQDCFSGVSRARSQIMSSIRGKGNQSTEQIMRMLLVRNGVGGWTLHARQIPGNPDFYFAREKIAIFVDGCFWHGCPRCGHIPKTRTDFWRAKIGRNRQRHAKVARLLRRQDVRVVRIWEHRLNTIKGRKEIVQHLRKIL